MNKWQRAMMSKTTRTAKRAALALALMMPINAEAESAVIRFDGSVTIQAAETGDNPRPNSVSIIAYNGGPLVVGGYDAPVWIDLDGVNGFGRSIPLLRDHNKQRIIGTIKAERVGYSIHATGKLVGNSNDRREVEEYAADGYEWQASVGARPLMLVKLKPGQKAMVNGQEAVGPGYIARKSRLAETSVVTVGSDDETSVAFPLLVANDPEDEDTVDEERVPVSGGLKRIKAERERRAAIEAAAIRLIDDGGDMEAIEAAMTEAIEAKLTPTEFELQLLREHRRPQGRISAGGGNELRGRELAQAVEASCMLHLGADPSELEKQFGERVLNAMDAHSELRHGLSLLDSMQFAAEQNRQRVSRRDLPAMLRASMPNDIQASGISTFSLSGIFSNIANKKMKAAFDSVESTWRQVCEIESVKDFKEITSYSLTGDMTYEKVGPTGELKMAGVGEQSFTNQAETYGRMFAMTRTDMINDDLGFLNAAPRRLGRGGALKLNDVFWTEFQENAGDFFGVANKNLVGSGSAPWYLLANPMDLAMIQVVFLNGRQVPIVEQAEADFKQLGVQFRGYHDFGVNKQEPRAAVKCANALTLDQLTAAHKLFLDQKDYDNKPLAIMAAILLTATGNMVEAQNIYSSLKIQSGNTGKVLENNPFAGMFRPVYSAYLGNS